MRSIEALKTKSFGKEIGSRPWPVAVFISVLKTVGYYWPIAASYDGLLSTLSLRWPRAAIGPECVKTHS